MLLYVMSKMFNVYLSVGKAPHFTAFKALHLGWMLTFDTKTILLSSWMFDICTWMRRGESLGMGRSLSASLFMYSSPLKDSDIFFFPSKNNFALHWMERAKIEEKAAEMRLFERHTDRTQDCTQVLNALLWPGIAVR